jgi:putative RNA 2'-phosphotransferase
LNQHLDAIRASQGHSIVVDLGYSAVQPPMILYHGTGEKFVESILATGLQQQGRQHVHLSEQIETAHAVGTRHGKPVVFEVMAESMFSHGFDFFLSENNVWLTEQVPVQYLRRR